jgi:hypothetical protein
MVAFCCGRLFQLGSGVWLVAAASLIQQPLRHRPKLVDVVSQHFVASCEATDGDCAGSGPKPGFGRSMDHMVFLDLKLVFFRVLHTGIYGCDALGNR